jgi:hypothetical protein
MKKTQRGYESESAITDWDDWVDWEDIMNSFQLSSNTTTGKHDVLTLSK